MQNFFTPLHLAEICRPNSMGYSGLTLPSLNWARFPLNYFCSHFHQAKSHAISVHGPSVWNSTPLGSSITSQKPPSKLLLRLESVLFVSSGVGSASQ